MPKGVYKRTEWHKGITRRAIKELWEDPEFRHRMLVDVKWNTHEPWNKGLKGCFSKETLRKMSKAKKGKPSPRKGIYHTAETKLKISQAGKGRKSTRKGKTYEELYGKEKAIQIKEKSRKAHLGQIGNWLGKHRSEETKRKVSIGNLGRTAWNRGKKMSEEYCKKLSEAHYKLVVEGKVGGENHYNWKGGKSFEPYPPTFNQQLKDKIRVRDKFICQLCGVPELECNSRLAIHHIDYNKNNCEMQNLLSLCRGCNSKVGFNRIYYHDFFCNLNNKERDIK